MRSFLNICVLIVSISIFSGCESGKVYDRIYNRAAVIEENYEEKSTVILSFYGEDNELYRTSGNDLNEALRNAEIGAGKSIFAGHTELVILGDCDYEETLAYMLNEWRVSPSCLVIYGGENAENILENTSASELADSVRRAAEQGKLPECDIITVLGGLLSDDGEAKIAAANENGFCGSRIIKNN